VQVVFFTVAIACAGLGGLLRAGFQDAEFLQFSLILMVAPLGIVILVSLIRGGYELYQNWRKEQEWLQNQPGDPWNDN
jgi:hypothetical protein